MPALGSPASSPSPARAWPQWFRILAAAYLTFELIALLAFWTILTLVPRTHAWFAVGDSRSVLLLFRWADLGILALLAAAGTVTLVVQRRLALPIVAAHAGAAAYASACTLAAVLDRVLAPLALWLMAPLALASLLAVVLVAIAERSRG